MKVVANGSSTGKISDYGRLVYVPHPVDGFQLGRLVDIGAETLSVEMVNGGHIVKVAYNDALPCEEDRFKDVDDNCGLMYLNEATLLNNCWNRYAKKKIYTYIANILISINPYEVIPGLYADETIREYKGKSLGSMAPHIYAIADKAHRDMKRLRQSQSIIVSGESGAGKTESQKCILRYLCHCFGGEDGSSAVEQRLLETNPILEAFGNAKTVRNNNSSRFGKFVEAHFDRRQRLAGGHVSHYLLERTRVCAQQPRERNFHVFYQLFVGDAGTMAERLSLTTPDKFNDAVLIDAVVDDCADFERLHSALRDIGFTDAELTDLFRTLAAILHLGNVEFDERADDVRGAAKILPGDGSERALATAAELLGLDVAQLRMGLTSRMMQPTKGGVKGTLIMVPLKARDCAAARDAFAKAIYSRLFDCVVARINASIPFDEDAAAGNYIGVLDIAGFEFFESNSFEQFCINYCNEKLQQFFNDRILRQEQQLYEAEGLNVARIEYSDNQDCIDLFEAKKTGLFDMLDEEARLPRASAQHFTLAVQQTHSKHPRLGVARKRKEYREVRDDEAFLVHHYADTVCYTTAAFLEKNNDSLHDSLQMLLEESENSFIKIVLATPATSVSSRNGKTKTGSNSGGGKLTAQTVGSKFRAQLQVLIEKLANTGTHFVRCVKPNSAMTPGGWNGAAILSQLKCAGMASVLRLMQKGFPSRTPFNELYAMYQRCLPERLARLDARMFCRCLFHALGLNDADYRFGLTKVFFRPGKFAEFDQLMKQDPADMKRLIDAVSAFVRRARWRKAQYGVWECIKLKNKILYRRAHLVRLQSAFRGTIARRRHRPRLVVLRKALAVADGQRRLVAICADGLRSNPALQTEWRAKIDTQLARGDALVCGIRSNDSLDAAVLRHLQSECDALESDYQKCLSALKQEISKTAEEAERIRQLEAEAERQRAAEEAECRERAERERTIQERRALETQRQRAIALDAERDHFNAERQQRMDARPAVNAQASDPVVEQSAKLGLIDWTYAKLRDVINTSTNIEFLEACREELHRRLRAYQEWKIVNQRNGDCGRGSGDGLGSAIDNGCATTAHYYGVDLTPSDQDTALSTSVISTIQRYFRVPFEKPAGQTDYSAYFNQCRGGGGFWYAHFDGQYVARQMELHPSKPPLLLVAGVNDEKMCELSLSETRLTHKKGAEILAIDFETLWHRYGGAPYVPRVGGGNCSVAGKS